MIGIVGIAAGLLALSQSNRKNRQRLLPLYEALYSAAYHKFYIDEIYLFITRKILFNIIGRTAAWFDKYIVDGLVNLTGTGTQAFAEKIKKFQSGKVQEYAIIFWEA